MSKVLSTKLAVDEVDRFSAAAEQQGLSKAGLLKNLLLDYNTTIYTLRQFILNLV